MGEPVVWTEATRCSLPCPWQAILAHWPMFRGPNDGGNSEKHGPYSCGLVDCSGSKCTPGGLPVGPARPDGGTGQADRSRQAGCRQPGCRGKSRDGAKSVAEPVTGGPLTSL